MLQFSNGLQGFFLSSECFIFPSQMSPFNLPVWPPACSFHSRLSTWQLEPDLLDHIPTLPLTYSVSLINSLKSCVTVTSGNKKEIHTGFLRINKPKWRGGSSRSSVGWWTKQFELNCLRNTGKSGSWIYNFALSCNEHRNTGTHCHPWSLLAQ